MPQPTEIRRPREVAGPRRRARLWRLAFPPAAAFLVLAATALAASAVHFYPDGLPASVGTHVLVDFNPSAAIPKAETPDSLAIDVPRGFTVDTRAVTRECTPAQASAVRCPRASRIGFGHVKVHVSGYLLPGGATDGVAYLTAFLGPPAAQGDPASIVMEVEWLGVDPAFQALNHYLTTKIQPRTSVTGRLVYVRSPTYGLEARFDRLPGGLAIPPPASSAGIAAAMTRFKVEIGAIRRVRKNIVHRMTVQGLGGPMVLKIKDHVLVARDLLSRPRPCPASGMWPWQIAVGFPDGVQTVAGQVRCHR
jgi:hypothetical protein